MARRVGSRRRGRTAALIAIVGGCVIGAPSSAAAAPVADASCGGPREDYYGVTGGPGSGAGNSRVAQVFTAVASGGLTSAQLDLQKAAGTTGDWSIRIGSVNGSGVPTDEVLASATIADATVPDGPSIVNVTFDSPAIVTAGQRYALVGTRPGADAVAFGARAENDCPGELFYSVAQTGSFGTTGSYYDMVFTVLVDPSLPKTARGVSLSASKRKVRRGRYVRLFGEIVAADNDPACEASQFVGIQRWKPSEPTPAQGDFSVFAGVVTSGVAGDFSARLQVKKTYLYRAVIGGNEECEDSASDIQRVRVKKRRR